MSWLSNYETLIMTSEHGACKYREDRMARVIRELVGRMRTAKVICAVTTKETEPQIVFDAIVDILGLLKDDFSPDAKEIVDESTAPRST